MNNKLFFAFLLILWAYKLHADEFEKKYGRGIVHIQPDSFTTIDFYSNPDSAFTYRLHMRPSGWSFAPVLKDGMHVDVILPPWFSALYFIPRGEYARVDIIAIDSINGFYRTILKDDRGRDVWIKKTEEVCLLSWFEFFQTLSSIELTSGDVILFEKANAKSKQLNYSKMYPNEKRTTMRPLEAKGMWMKVEIQYPDADQNLPWHVYTGWIKWRDEKRLLVKYNLMGC